MALSQKYNNEDIIKFIKDHPNVGGLISIIKNKKDYLEIIKNSTYNISYFDKTKDLIVRIYCIRNDIKKV